MGKISQIPIRTLEERGKSTFEISRIEPCVRDFSIYLSNIKHRDDYFAFIYLESGKCTITVDFQAITLTPSSIFCIQPGQVHSGNFTPTISAWILLATAEWIPAEFRNLLMNTTILSRPVGISTDTDVLLFRDALRLLQTFEDRNDFLTEQAIRSMFDVCLQLFIQLFQQATGNSCQSNLRPVLITRQFKSLLFSNFRHMKSPSEYASILNITPAYLNEVVKGTTGFPVSHWIHQEIILEARRSLFYTNTTVKEIAYALGYSDPAYFIRLFKRVTGISPLQFRQKYLK
ncbi:helix-turn-helix domain-containing protein [Chitinophaga tropicalis]|uniref:Helix-turn-helix domain-containing protein n=1 Tax=Chitinophaga tropicalis TaxID=2683588 RepID=A0A7K1U318_9BACT|nr:helix-turn-helix transcriptional regulator [Chitinophaga tropicalis]MVT08762.1 helix-turn-helix domain-containing protein [Chitinophaga tropicalis]